MLAVLRLLFMIIACVAVSSLAGCGPAEPRLYEVRGTVTFNGKPLTTGTVSLRADGENETRHQPTGLIDARGNYRIYTTEKPGAPPGWYRVVVFATEPLVDSGNVSPGLPKSIIPVRYNSASTSLLLFEVKAQPAVGDYDLKLNP